MIHPDRVGRLGGDAAHRRTVAREPTTTSTELPFGRAGRGSGRAPGPNHGLAWLPGDAVAAGVAMVVGVAVADAGADAVGEACAPGVGVPAGDWTDAVGEVVAVGVGGAGATAVGTSCLGKYVRASIPCVHTLV